MGEGRGVWMEMVGKEGAVSKIPNSITAKEMVFNMDRVMMNTVTPTQ